MAKKEHPRQYDYDARQRKRGLTRVTTWCPIDDRQKLINYAAGLVHVSKSVDKK